MTDDCDMVIGSVRSGFVILVVQAAVLWQSKLVFAASAVLVQPTLSMAVKACLCCLCRDGPICVVNGSQACLGCLCCAVGSG